jgi:tetratricopeptide (TPR) repeat protein
LQYFEKCQDVAKRAHDEEIEADCYQRIGLIYHLLGHFDESIEYTTKFLHLCESHTLKCTNEHEKRHNSERLIQAHKQLAETYVKDPNRLSMAIHELQKVINEA